MPSGELAASIDAQRNYRGKAPAARHAERRARLMDSALDHFGTVGYFGTSIEALCASARVAPRHFYEHFESKEDLLIALYDELLDGVAKHVIASLAQSSLEPEASARAGLKAFIESVTGDPRKAKVVIVGLIGVSERCERRRRDALHAFADIIAEQRARVVSKELLEPRDMKMLSLALVGATIETLIDWLNEPRATIENMLDELVHLFVASTAIP